MRKTAIIFILLLFIPTAAKAITEEINNDELSTLASLAMDQDLAIDTWQVTIKENMKLEQLQNVINKLKEKYKLSITEDENAVKYTVRNAHKSEEISVLYKAIIPKDK